jgi:A/G-specific adenine glycosylase
MISFLPAKALIDWFSKNARTLPWREDPEPYKVWLSEILLQQTRTAQGLPYYYRFLEAFPNLESLAKGSEKEVLKLWQGLGYYSRARNLHRCAREVQTKFGGEFPRDIKVLQSLPGIGPYTAAAIGSICFGIPEPVVDGNVYRVISRFGGLKQASGSSGLRNNVLKILEKWIPEKEPGNFNQALMELGALVCTPQKPDCRNCPLQSGCFAFAKGKPHNFPVKKTPVKIKKRHFSYWVISNGKTLYMKRRGKGDIWEGLYDFPLTEIRLKNGSNPKKEVGKIFRGISANMPVFLGKRKLSPHKLSHQEIHAELFFFAITGNKIPVPRLIEKAQATFTSSFLPLINRKSK